MSGEVPLLWTQQHGNEAVRNYELSFSSFGRMDRNGQSSVRTIDDFVRNMVGMFRNSAFQLSA